MRYLISIVLDQLLYPINNVKESIRSDGCSCCFSISQVPFHHTRTLHPALFQYPPPWHKILEGIFRWSLHTLGLLIGYKVSGCSTALCQPIASPELHPRKLLPEKIHCRIKPVNVASILYLNIVLNW